MTIIYYSSSREKEAFAAEVRRRLIAAARGLPIISVTQKPLDFGENICVGDVGVSNHNVFRQIQIGCEAAGTPYVAMAEADCLYPAGHFEFRPEGIGCVYRNVNLWILYCKHRRFRRKEYSLCSQIAGREMLIAAIDKCMEGKPEWNPELEHRSSLGNKPPHIFKKRSWQRFRTERPCINVCHNDGMHRSTGTFGAFETELDGYGRAEELLEALQLDPWEKK